MDYKELEYACGIFGFTGRAGLKEVRKRHRELVKKYHPDACEGGDPEHIKEINASYKVLMDYCESFRYSFSEAEFYEQNPGEHLRKQFMDDPIWGNGK